MIIRQRQTFIDPFLLKVVYPYLAGSKNRTLFKFASYWNQEVAPASVEERPIAVSWPQGTHSDTWFNRLSHTLARWLQPQMLIPIPALVRSEAEERRRSRSNRAR
jgi:hypothetical protein